VLDTGMFTTWVSGYRDTRAEAGRLRTTLAAEYREMLSLAAVADDLAKHLDHLAALRARLNVLDDLIEYHTLKGETQDDDAT
jgi:hypothetical protein